MVALVSVVALLLFGGAIVRASDVNWGKKVKCFVVGGSAVCPGCNYRAGLTCPRSLKNSQNCLTTTLSSTEEDTTEISYDEDTKSTEEQIFNSNLTTPDAEFNFNLTTPDTDEIQKEPTKPPVDLSLYLYRMLDPPFPSYYRYKREVKTQQKEEELEICNWNGDCPCPLICCRTGPGCPNRCVMGMRLPPPWG